MSTSGVPVLEVRGLSKNFGGVQAVSNVNLSIRAGDRHGILGANGAGKTTVFNLVCGVYPPTSGSVVLAGEDITTRSINYRVRKGLGRTFQITNLFQEMTVLENVILATAMAEAQYNRWFTRVDTLMGSREKAEKVLQRLGLEKASYRTVAEIGYGQQRELEVALALALEPKVLLLDEFTAGLSQVETASMVELVKGLPEDLAVIIIEHDLDVIFGLVDEMTVMNRGQVICEGSCQDVRENPLVAEVYIGQKRVG